ncbi:MAG TPA: Yip1 family protein [Patescibacteria group bacterium]|nr:Yip1 family protein [Patescibacteria group bacterium]
MSLTKDPRANVIVARVKNIITKPSAEWDVIAAEPATVKSLYTGYAMILAAIPCVAGFLGTVMIAPRAAGIALITAISSYILGLLGIAVMALVVDFLAPKFGGTSNQVNAFKLAIYSATPVWIAGVLLILPVLGGLAILIGVVYSLYLFYLGVPKLMKTPVSQAGIFTIVALVVNVLVQFCIRALAGIGH